MTLTTHIIIAEVVARPLARLNPIFGFIVGILSHYLLDAIPHWDYKLKSSLANENRLPGEKKIRFTRESFWPDVAKTALDTFIGLIIILFLMPPKSIHETVFLLATAFGGVLPDFLQGAYGSGYAEFLKPVQKFHDTMHTKIKLGPYPLIGVPFQIFIILIAVYFLV